MFRTGSENSLFPSLQATAADIRVPRSSRVRTAVIERSRGVATREFLVQLLTVFLVYFVAGKIGQATTNIRSSNLGPVWPAYGIAVAAFLACGWRVWPGIVVSAFVVAVSLVIVGAFGSALVSASIGLFSLYATGVQAYSGIESAFLIYWLGDSTGV